MARGISGQWRCGPTPQQGPQVLWAGALGMAVILYPVGLQLTPFAGQLGL